MASLNIDVRPGPVAPLVGGAGSAPSEGRVDFVKYEGQHIRREVHVGRIRTAGGDWVDGPEFDRREDAAQWVAKQAAAAAAANASGGR